MTNLITDKELHQLNKVISKVLLAAKDKHDYDLYFKLLTTYDYYKERVSELELQIEDLLDRDLI